MKRLLTLMAVLLIFAVSPVGEVAVARAEGFGQHPWDLPDRRRTRRYQSGTWGYRNIDNFYYSRFRTETHALHPYYRGRYPYLGYDGQNFRRYAFRDCGCDWPVSAQYDRFRVRKPHGYAYRKVDGPSVFERAYQY